MMLSNYANSKRRGFTLTEMIVAVAIFSTVMAGVAAVFISSLHASDSARAKLEIFEQVRAFADFVERDISGTYRSRDLDDCATFIGDNDQIAFLSLGQNFGSSVSDITLISYYLLDDPQYDEPMYRRFMRVTVPMPFEAVTRFVSGYPRLAEGVEVLDARQYDPAENEYFPSDADLDWVVENADPVYRDHAVLLGQIPPQDRLFPQTDEQLQDLFAVLHARYGIEYGWTPDPTDPNRFDYVWIATDQTGTPQINDSMAPQLDDFELVTLTRDVRFRYGRIQPAGDINVPDAGPGGYKLSPRGDRYDAIDTTVAYGLQNSWNSGEQFGPPEVVELNMTFISRTRAVRDAPLAQPFYSLIYIPMAFDRGSSS